MYILFTTAIYIFTLIEGDADNRWGKERNRLIQTYIQQNNEEEKETHRMKEEENFHGMQILFTTILAHTTFLY